MPPQYDVSVKVEELSVCRRRATITVPASAVKDVFKRGVKRIEVRDGLHRCTLGLPCPGAAAVT